MKISIISFDTSHPHHVKFSIDFGNGKVYTEVYAANPDAIYKFERMIKRSPGKAYAFIKKSPQVSSTKMDFAVREYIADQTEDPVNMDWPPTVLAPLK